MVSEADRSRLQTLFTAAVAAVDPRHLIERIVQLDRDRLIVQTPNQTQHVPLTGRIFILGAGKGAGLLAQGLESVLGKRVTRGIVSLPQGQQVNLQRVIAIQGEHPIPGQGSLMAAEQVASLLTSKKDTDLICFCLTGGASSLLVSPVPGLSLADKLEVNRQLIACGADIVAINTVRKHLSRLKGGGLARLAFPSPLVSFILSDVIGDDLSTIGSGPTVPDPTTFRDAWELVDAFEILDKIPASARAYLQQGCEGFRQETPKPGDKIFTHVSNILIGSNRIALEAAAVKAKLLGFTPWIVDNPLHGDTADAARRFSDTMQQALARNASPVCLLAGGETTVRVTGSGKGGRNQEFALIVAQTLQHDTRWALLSAGTDGIDGPTDAAGAFVDGQSIKRATEKGLDPQEALSTNNSYPFFAALGELFCPGQTGTNVMDIKIALLRP
ncbi:MAG: glycerate kinase [Candidatus Binatia bacterium]